MIRSWIARCGRVSGKAAGTEAVRDVLRTFLLMTLDITGETTQGQLGNILALDSTSLTRMLEPLIKRGWISVKAGQDRRRKLLQLTSSGRQKFEQSRPDWQRAQRRLQRVLGELTWSQMGALLTEVAGLFA